MFTLLFLVGLLAFNCSEMEYDQNGLTLRYYALSSIVLACLIKAMIEILSRKQKS